VIYDNIEFTKKGWINRNRILVNGKDEYITVPLKKDSDYKHVCDRQLSDSWPIDRKKMLNRITESYRKAPFFNVAYPVIEKILVQEDTNLFHFIFHSVRNVSEYLGITTEFVVSSTIPIDHGLKAQDKVIAICKSLKADTYVNPIGGIELYSKEDFSRAGIRLNFINSGGIKYNQFGNEFVPSLSIIDVMMFNAPEECKKMLNLNTLV